MSNITIAIPKPHSYGQYELITTNYSVVCFAGRRYGKTQAGVTRILMKATERVGLYWWVGISWRSASMKRAWRLLKYYVRKIYKSIGKDPVDYIMESTKEIVLPNGSSIWLRSSERPDSLAGEGVHGVVIDEFSLMKSDIWYEFLEPTLVDYGGWSFFIGVPNGDNWAAQLWRNAETRSGWLQRHYTTYDNPFVSSDIIDDIKENVPLVIFEEQYLAKISEDGLVFKREWIHYRETLPRPAKFVMYVDKAGTEDGGAYTAMVLMARASDNAYYIVDVVRGQWAYAEREDILLSQAIYYKNKYGNENIKIAIEQEPGSGGVESADRTIRMLSGFNRIKDNPKGDKDARLKPVTYEFKSNNVFIIEGDWNSDYVDELLALPRGAYRDQSDATSGAFKVLTDMISNGVEAFVL